MGLTPHQFVSLEGLDMSKKDVLKTCRSLALASAKPGFDPQDIRAWEEEISSAGWRFECVAKGTFAATAPDGDAWVIKTPRKGRQKTVAYSMADFALYEQAGQFVCDAMECKTRKDLDSLIEAFGGVCSLISAKSLVTELEDGMARAVAEFRESPELEVVAVLENGAKLAVRREPEEFAPEKFAEAHGLEYRSTGLNEWVSGETKPYRDELKANGFKWAQKRRAWYRRAA